MIPDWAHLQTDKEIEALKQAYADTFRQALEEMQAYQAESMSGYEWDREWLEEQLERADISPEKYKAWCEERALNQAWRADLIDRLSIDAVRAEQECSAMLEGRLQDTFALHANWAAFEIEGLGNLGLTFAIYDQQTVARLVAEQPDLLPAPRVDAKKSLDWNRSKFANAMTQGILQGESIPKLAERISDVVGSDYAASVRYARTAMTGAQNAGRTTRQQEAADMGIDVRRQWMATLDSRTRDSHRLMDGETVGVNEEFSNGLMYPGDPSGDPSEVYNCRCTVVSVVDGKSVVNGSSGRVSVGLQGKSYEEWKAGHGD